MAFDFNWSADAAPLWGAPDRSVRFNDARNAATDRATYEQLQAAYQADDTERLRRAQMERDREYELRAQNIENQAKQIAISQGQAKANEWYQKQMVQLSKEKFQEEQRQFDLTFGEGQRQFNVSQSGYMDNGNPTLAREQFQDSGLRSWAQLAASLKGPETWVQYKALTGGVADNIGSIPGLSWTQGGQVGNTTFQGTPQVLTTQKLLGDLGVGGSWAAQGASQAQQQAAMSPQEQQLYRTADEFARNPQQAASGWYESLDPTTQSLLKGAAESQGHDWATALSRYGMSRWGGGAGVGAA